VGKLSRVCLLTGASGALGSAFIGAYGADYAIVAVHHEHEVAHPTQHQSAFDPLDPQGRPTTAPPVWSIRADVRDPAAVCDAVAERHGGLDLIVNAAAYRSFGSLLADGATETAQYSMEVNVVAPLRLSIACAQRFWMGRTSENLRQNRNVVNISSTAGRYVYPDSGQAIYAASKAALDHLTYHLASELWDIGVRVNAVAPNTFPALVETRRVLEAIVALDRGDQTGEIIVVDR
jgi:NAD(P)-dependent dehydrogenase (short-subunit alcohol dehydrogenase family)